MVDIFYNKICNYCKNINNCNNNDNNDKFIIIEENNLKTFKCYDYIKDNSKK